MHARAGQAGLPGYYYLWVQILKCGDSECRKLELPISIQDESKRHKYMDTYRVSSFSTADIEKLKLCIFLLYV